MSTVPIKRTVWKCPSNAHRSLHQVSGPTQKMIHKRLLGIFILTWPCAPYWVHILTFSLHSVWLLDFSVLCFVSTTSEKRHLMYFLCKLDLLLKKNGFCHQNHVSYFTKYKTCLAKIYLIQPCQNKGVDFQDWILHGWNLILIDCLTASDQHGLHTVLTTKTKTKELPWQI